MTREFIDMLWDASLRMGSPETAKYDVAYLVAAYEREACAKVVEANAEACDERSSIARDVLIENALAIRARGDDQVIKKTSA